MTFIPRDLEAGDHVVLRVPLRNESGTFLAGHEFEVFDVHPWGPRFTYDLRDHDLNLLLEVPGDDLERTRSADDA